MEVTEPRAQLQSDVEVLEPLLRQAYGSPRARVK